MEEIEIDPRINNGVKAFDAYRLEASLFTIPFVVSNDLTLTKSRIKYFEEFRMVPKKYMKVLEAKSISLTEPVDITLKPREKICQSYWKGSSSQHMSTILEGIDEAGINFNGVDILVASETLQKIAGAVFKRDKSWKLRAYSEKIDGHNVIILCDDDFEKIELLPLRSAQYLKEREESINFAQKLCERYEKRNTNPFLHGSKVVITSIAYKSSTVRMAVVGEVDMATEKQSVNTTVLTGRTQRVSLGFDEERLNESFEYLWGRCFWLGMTTCVVGMRSCSEDPVTRIHRFDIKDYCLNHPKKIGSNHDIATTCVAQVMNRLQEAIKSNLSMNWIVEYEGRDKRLEHANIKICVAAESYSMWLIRENYYITKRDFNKRMIEEATRMANRKRVGVRANEMVPPNKRMGSMKTTVKGSKTIDRQLQGTVKKSKI